MGQDNQKKAQRNIGLDILRILAMFMILLLHYLGKGNLLEQSNTDFLNYRVYWVIECLSIVAVNCYVLISGYFMIKSEFKIKKLIKLWVEVIFYSVTVYITLVLLGLQTFDIKEAIKSFLPVITNQYWFVNSYLAMYLLSPYINKLILNLKKDELQKLIGILLILFSVMAVLPVEMALDKSRRTSELYGLYAYI